MTDQIKLSTRFYDEATKSAANIITYFGEQRQQLLEALRANVTGYAEMEEKFKLLRAITSRFTNQSNEALQAANEGNNEAYADIQNLYKEYEGEVSKIAADLSNNRHLKEFSDQLEQIIASIEQHENLDDTEDDLRITANERNVICPISKTRMTDPVKNEICGHIYDKESVTAMIKVNSKTRCPVVGCNNKEYLRMDHLKSDIVMKLYLQKNS